MYRMFFGFVFIVYTVFPAMYRSVLTSIKTILVKLRVVHAPGKPGTFSRPLRIRDHDMHHGTWFMPVSLTSGFLWSWWRGKRSWQSRRMCNPQFWLSGKRPIDDAFYYLPTDSPVSLGEIPMLQFSCSGTRDIGPLKNKAMLTIILACGQQYSTQDSLIKVFVQQLMTIN